MMNYIWAFLIAFSIIISFFTGKIADVGASILLSAKFAVNVVISLIGIMAFWLGIVKIAEKSGLMDVLVRFIAPVCRFLFPSIPSGHPALGSIATSFSANALGIANAATPIGIRAMEQMQELNPQKNTATDAMCMFLAINTAGFQLVPASAMAVLVAVGCYNPSIIILPALIATTIALIIAIFSVKMFEFASFLKNFKEEK